MKNKSTFTYFYLSAIVLLVMASVKSFGQASILYSNTASGTWQTTSNWTGSVVPTATDIAQIGINPTGSTGVGIDMGATTNNGTANQAVGAVEMTSARTAGNPVIGNSSTVTAGVLTFTGATVNAIPNVIIRNNSSQNITFQNIQGTGTSSMSIALVNTTDNKIMQDAGGKIIISSMITGASNCPLTVQGIGTSEVDITNAGNTFSGLITLNASETVFSADGCFGSVPGSVITNAITIDGGRMTANATYTLNSNRGIKLGNTVGTSISVKTGTTILTYNGIMSDLSTNGSWAKQGGNVFQIGGSNIYTGSTGINNGAIRLINGNNRLPVTTTLNIGQAASTNLGIFDLNGFNQQVAGLNSVAGTNGTASKNTVTTSTSPSTLTLGGAGTYSYGFGTTVNSGIISGSVSLVKSGTGIQVLGDVNTYVGSTTVNSGELRFSPNANEALTSSPVTLNGGTLSTTGIASNKSISFSTLNLTDNSVITLESANTNTLNFAASSSVTWNASKTLTVTGWQGSYSSGTAGTLGRLFVGASATDLTTAQLARIVFFNGTAYFPSTQLPSGEVVPFCITPTITSVSANTVLCAGSNISLSVTAVGNFSPTYTWAGPNSYSTTVQNPTITAASASASGVYTITASNSCGTGTAAVSVTVNALPAVVANTSSAVVCSSQSITLSGSGASTYTWTSGVSNGVAFAPATTTVYTVTGTDVNSCINTATVSVTVNITPTLSVNAATICAGASVTLAASGASTYTWNTSANTASIVVAPSSTTNYTITGSNPGCTSTLTTAITVYTVPVLSVNAPTICAGITTTLTVSGANTYSWSTGSTASSVSVTPPATAVYTITGTSTQSCVSSLTTQVTVNALPPVNSVTTSVCAGGTATLTVTGAATYTWSNGSNSTSIVITPVSNTNFTITGTSAQGCVNTTTTGVTLTSSPSITVSSPTICTGSAVTLTATGVSTYTWSTGATTSTISVNPTGTATYTLSGNASGCAVTATNSATVSVNPLPTVTVNSPTICSGNSATLIATGASTYSWSTGGNTGTVTPSPATTQVYTVTGTSSLSCVNTATAQVTVIASPTLNAGSATICAGSTATLTVSGATTYTWSTSSTATSIAVSPVTTTNYTVTGTSSTCPTSKVLTVTVNGLPTVTVNNATVCAGSSATLTAGGASTYSWSTSSTATAIVVAPASTLIYTVTGTSTLNCAGTATAQVTVNNLPTVTVNAATVCAGTSTVLTASGASTYSWNASTLTPSINVTPLVNTTYTVTGTTTGCSSSATVAVTVNTLPAVAAPSTSLCSGSTATLTASGASTYSWSSGTQPSTGSTVNASPLVNTTYTVTGTSAQGCVQTATTAVNVIATPTITANSPTICAGGSATIVATGGIAYVWLPSSVGASLVVSPLATTIYTGGGISLQNCVGIVFATVVVNPLPVVSLNIPTATLCAADNTVALAGTPAGGSYSGTGVTGNAFSPATAGVGSYTVTYQYADSHSCSGSANRTVVVDACTGIKENVTASVIRISPNPAQQEISIKNETFAGEYAIAIYDLTGKQVHASVSGLETTTVDINHLPNGLYIMKITENNKQSTLKFIKN